MSLYVHGQDIGLGFGICGLDPLVQIIIYLFILFLSQSVYAQQFFFFEQCICSLTHVNHSPSFMKTNFFGKNSPREKIFLCIHFESERERNIELVATLRFFFVLQIFLSQEADVYQSQNTTICVRVEIYFKEIVSNTRLDLNHLSFTHLVCKLLIICRFLFKDMQSIYLLFLLSHLFVLLLIFRSICCSFWLITKVNC